MQAQRTPSTVTPLSTAVPGPSTSERRTKKRFQSQQIKLTFLGFEHVAINWSLGGVLVEDRHPRLAIGTDISGVMTVRAGILSALAGNLTEIASNLIEVAGTSTGIAGNLNALLH